MTTGVVDRPKRLRTVRWVAAIIFTIPPVLFVFMNTAWWLDVMHSAIFGVREPPKAWVALLALGLVLVPYGVGWLAWWACRRMGVKTPEGSCFVAAWPAGLVALILAVPSYYPI
jgi:hypothetical protein